MLFFFRFRFHLVATINAFKNSLKSCLSASVKLVSVSQLKNSKFQVNNIKENKKMRAWTLCFFCLQLNLTEDSDSLFWKH